jgi:hypothetical protein
MEQLIYFGVFSFDRSFPEMLRSAIPRPTRISTRTATDEPTAGG